MPFNALNIDDNAASLVMEVLYVPAGTSITTSVPSETFLNGYADVPNAPTLLTPAGTVDFDNTTTQDANLINGNLTGDFIYNNSSQGSANKTLPAIDLGTPTTVGSINVYWYNTPYICNTFDLEYSVDGTNWTVIGTYAGVWQGNSATPQTVSFANITARYVRIRCINGNNASWFVLREMQAFSPASSVTQVWLGSIQDLTVIQNGSFVEINNQTPYDLNMALNYLS